ELVAAADWGDDLEAALGQQPCEALADDDCVVGENHTHGISARSCVPPPGGLTTAKQPPSASIRSQRPLSPPPGVGVAPPTPSSSTSTTARQFCRSMSMCTREAAACLAAFASASAARKYAAVSTAAGRRRAGTLPISTGTGERRASVASAASSPSSLRIAG